MPIIHKIQVELAIAGEGVGFEVFFSNEDDAKSAVEFLMSLEETVGLEHTGIEDVGFEDFKERLGNRIDECRKDAPIKKLFEAMTAANKVAA